MIKGLRREGRLAGVTSIDDFKAAKIAGEIQSSSRLQSERREATRNRQAEHRKHIEDRLFESRRRYGSTLYVPNPDKDDGSMMTVRVEPLGLVTDDPEEWLGSMAVHVVNDKLPVAERMIVEDWIDTSPNIERLDDWR